MTGVIQGNDALVEWHDGDSYKVFVCAKDMSISYNTSYVNITTYGDGMWDKFAKQSDGYTMTLNGVATFKDQSMTVWDMLERQRQGLETKFRIIYTDEQDQNTRVLFGSMFIEATTVNANVGQVVTGDLSLIGNGALNIFQCAVQIGSVSTNVFDTTSVEVTINDVDGTPAYYLYQVDNGDEQTTVTNPFTILDQPGGFHSIIVTPMCSGDRRGMEANADFYIEVVVPEDPDIPVVCPNVTGLSVSNITSTGFRVNWTRPVEGSSVNVVITNITTQEVINYPNQTGSFVNVTGLNPAIEYQARVITNCTDNTQSSGISTNATTANPPSNIQGTIYNAHPTITLESLTFSEGEYGIAYGTIPLPPNQSAGIINVPAGLNYVTISMSNTGSDQGHVTVITETQQFDFYGDNVIQVLIGSGGISITITP